MSAEKPNLSPKKIEQKVEDRLGKLPNGIRKHIRRLKEEGKLEEALKVRKEAVERRSAQQKLEDKLNDSLRQAILGNEEEQAIGEFTATWIIAKKDNLTPEERIADLQSVYDNHPKEDKLLEESASKIRDEVSKLHQEANS